MENICKNCKYYHIDEIPDTPCVSSLIMALGKALENSSIENYCEHPCLESDDCFVWTRLSMRENDFCSRFEKKED